MKAYNLIIHKCNGQYDDTIVTEEMLNQYEHSIKPHVSYVPDEDLSVIWAVESLELPEGSVMLKREIIGFIYGSPEYRHEADRIFVDAFWDGVHRMLVDYTNAETTALNENFVAEINEIKEE